MQAAPFTLSVPPVHKPLVQLWPDAQTVPQAPQLFGSLLMAVQTPLHVVCPASHPQAPPEHSCPDGHLLPQAPQLFRSELMSMQVLLHNACPDGHELAAVQTPATQDPL